VEILSATQSGRQFFSNSHRAILDRHCLIIVPLDPKSEEELPRLQVSRTQDFDFHTIDWKSIPTNTAYFDADKVTLPLTLRHWHEGDRFQPLGLPHGTQLVSDFFTDHKYTLIDKRRQLLLLDASGRIIWLVGRRTSHHPRVTPSTTTLLKVSVVQSGD
jgi:tRNA(Ile)-lysidine synthase